MHAPGESLPVSSRAVRDRRLLVSSEAVAGRSWLARLGYRLVCDTRRRAGIRS